MSVGRAFSIGARILVAGVLLAALPRAPLAQPAPTKSSLVRGYIVTTVGGKSELGPASPPLEDIYLPNIRVVLRNLSTQAQSDPVITDLSGRFTARVMGPGRFAVCWEGKGFGAGCVDQIISVSEPFQNLSTVRIPIPRGNNRVAVYGTVRMSDGSSPRVLEPLANINAFATVSLLDPAGAVLYTLPVNNHDQYLFPQVPLRQLYQVEIRDEGYKQTQALKLGNGSVPTQRIDITIDNEPPKIEPLVALDSNKQRVSGGASPASTVTLNARVSDRDNDSLRFVWQVSGGTISSPTDLEPQWTLPNTASNHAATLIAYDGRGGYAKSSFNVNTQKSGLVFSGIVSGTDTPTLAGAQVEVNGNLTVTDSTGFFTIGVPDRKRFVMTIRKTGYAFASNVYYNAVVGGSWKLTRASVFQVASTQTIDVQNKRSIGECRGAASDRLDWRANPALAVPQYQDGRGNLAPLPKDARDLPGLPSIEPKPPRRDGCGPGVQVQIPANSLVDALGNAPTGLVDLQISTVDLATPDQMPGNYSVEMPGGDVKVMQSYGAGAVEISASGRRLNLRQGAAAQLIIPVDPTQIQAGGQLAPTIPLLSYNEARGVWTEDGSLTLQTVNGAPAYVGKVTHFTAYNSDNIKTDQSCLAVQNQNMPVNYDIELTIPQPTGTAPVKRHFSGVTGSNTEIALLNLPKKTNVVVVPIRTSGPNANLPMGVFVVNTGEPQNPAWPTVPGGFINEPQGPPYYHETNGVSDGACSTKIVLQDLGLKFYPDPTVGAFLHGLGNFAAVNLTDTDVAFPADTSQTLRNAVAQASQQYHDQIDPRGLRPTLSCYKVVNRMPLKAGESCPELAATGFVPQPALSETKAVYANTIDLGFGREMHCVQDVANVACYVSNYDSQVYTGPGQGSDVTKAQSAVDGVNGLKQPDATVAMEFSQIEDALPPGGLPSAPIVFSDAARVVKFYVFNYITNPAGSPANAANLDGLGARPVPQLCMVCHGGHIPNPSGVTTTQLGIPTPVFGSRDDVKLDAKFLPFDLQNLTFVAAGPFNQANQEEAFRLLNSMAKVAPPPDAADPTSTVISALYDAWYPGNVSPQKVNAAVALWDDPGDPQRAQHKQVYIDTVGRACRTCHITNADPVLRFDRPSNFDLRLGAVQQRVCQQHVMPHARRTHDLFWTSINPSQPAGLQAYGDTVVTGGWQKVGTPNVDQSLLCGQEYTQGGGPPVPPTQFSPVATIISGKCAFCHTTANAANVAGLDLQANAYGHLVGINATELVTLKRVLGGTNTEDPSYLWHKVKGDFSSLPGCCSPPGPGGTMPLSSPPLGQAQLDTIRNWLQNGAQP